MNDLIQEIEKDKHEADTIGPSSDELKHPRKHLRCSANALKFLLACTIPPGGKFKCQRECARTPPNSTFYQISTHHLYN